VLAFILGKLFSNPILRLVGGMNKVKEGDLSASVEPTTKDEIGLLTQTFNDMIIGLRERFHLTRYVGSHTMEMIKKSSDQEVSLGGTRQRLAVLFSDVRGFTAYSEKRTPEEVINMLNRYLGYQAELVTLFNGSIDKFVGDEMVALFGGKDAIQKALECAVAIQKLVKKEHETDPTPIHIGIGISYGPMVLGNMGAKERMDYTVIGAAVNLGARLCGAADPGQILLPKLLLKAVNGNYNLGETKFMSFKGFSKEIEIVEVLSD
jgi:adenylate cyclase